MIDDEDLRADEVDPGLSGEEDVDETAAEKRLRLAKIYLDGVKTALGAFSFMLGKNIVWNAEMEILAEGEFDAADLDRDIIQSRLQQDVVSIYVCIYFPRLTDGHH